LKVCCLYCTIELQENSKHKNKAELCGRTLIPYYHESPALNILHVAARLDPSLGREELSMQWPFFHRIHKLTYNESLTKQLIDVTITIFDIIHRPVFYLKIRFFCDWILSLSSGGTYSDGPNTDPGTK
jgi:hypothetical protein